jgi:hypothetical protein
MNFIEILALLRSLLYASDATYAFIRKSYYVSLVAVALTFLPLVNQFGTRKLQLEMAIFNALLLSLFIYKHVKLERELKRALLMLAGIKEQEMFTKDTETKRFARASAGVLVVGIFLATVVYLDVKNGKPEDRFAQPPVTTHQTPSPAPDPPPILIDRPANSMVQPQSAPSQANPNANPQVQTAPSSTGTSSVAPPPVAAPTLPVVNLQPITNQVQQILPPSVKL